MLGKNKSAGCWKLSDLDYILIKGDELYKNIKRCWSPEDMPNNLKVENANLTIEYIYNLDFNSWQFLHIVADFGNHK